jgi:Nucleotidyl transferase AbiEii toxin, Type IV TA system
MPLSEIQCRVLKQIAANRNPASYLAGATVIHRAADTPRFSQDIDLFHDLEESIAQSAETDAATLRAAGYDFNWLLRTPGFHRAVVTMDEGQLTIEWAQDSAFRFFPIVEDDLCGYSLHDADAAINKVLALAGRSEIRDFVDVLFLHDNYLSLGAMAWAGCGKDPGFTPEFLLDHATRHIAYTQADLDRLHLRVPIDLRGLKLKWLAALDEARSLVAALPADEVGCLYLAATANQAPVTPDPASDQFKSLLRHQGCVRGAWPTTSLQGPDTR